MSTYIDDILNGECDGKLLDQLEDAIRERRASLANRRRFKLAKGDTVTFSDVIRPKYLVGLKATVEKVNPKSVVVSCPDDASYGRFRNAKNVRCPFALIADPA